jgi:hypothetical protein
MNSEIRNHVTTEGVDKTEIYEGTRKMVDGFLRC